MDLPKSSATTQINVSRKFVLPCQTRMDSGEDKTWLQIQNKLVENAPVLKGILERGRNVVVKYGTPGLMSHEYSVSESLFKFKVPNMMKYFCSFQCLDDINTVVTKGTLCNGGNQMGYIVMPYYTMGDMNHHVWNRDNFGVLKNVLTQICFALLYASETCGFVHNDLHMYNVLLRQTRKTQLSYGDVQLPIDSLYAIIMDFERSHTHEGQPQARPRDAYFTIRGVLNLATSLEKSDMALNYNMSHVNSWMSANTPITEDTYSILKTTIDTMTILYEKSKIPANPFGRR